MDEIREFVDKVADIYSKMQGTLEDDQALPSLDVLERVCHVLINVSTMHEELRYPSFRVCFIHPDSDLLDVYIYAHTLLFEDPIEFNSRELRRLAPALNADMSYLILDTTSGPEYKILGINASYTTWENIIVKEKLTGNRMPKIPNLYLKGPGEMDACIGETTLVKYRSGTYELPRTDAFTSSPVADELVHGSTISEENRLKVLYRIIWNTRRYRHGGHLYIVPSEEACEGYLKIKYRTPCRFAFGSLEKLAVYPHADADKSVITYADVISKFTAVDGGVILDKDLNLIGFGAEVILADASREMRHLSFIGSDGQVNESKRYSDYGMCHRVCYRFCNFVENSVAIIISQDGAVEACTKKDGTVVVYDNIALPLV